MGFGIKSIYRSFFQGFRLITSPITGEKNWYYVYSQGVNIATLYPNDTFKNVQMIHLRKLG